MKRWLLRIGAGAAIAVLGFAVWARLLAGRPVSFIPGGWIRGEVVTEPVHDWSFAAGRPSLLVESRARWLPYSSKVWFMVSGGRLYLLLPALFGGGMQQRLEEDPNLRVGIEGRIYPQRAKAVTSDALVGELMGPILRRIASLEIEGPVRRSSKPSRLEGATMAIFVLENR